MKNPTCVIIISHQAWLLDRHQRSGSRALMNVGMSTAQALTMLNQDYILDMGGGAGNWLLARANFIMRCVAL
jgi:hypothetical protein